MDRKLGHWLRVVHRGLRWGLLTGASAIAALGIEALPAAAAELTDWGYDAQARSLTVTVPSNISPSVSVVATDQLLLSLPDTQMGEVTGLNVSDGIVDNITLEQSTPDTLWIVMEFAEGTVLATEQRVVPIASTADVAAAGQQWEIRPALVASSRTAPVPVATEDNATELGTDAADLRAPEVSIAQADFPDLPILEPGISLTEPVSVPPIGATDPVPATNAAPPPPPPPPPPPAPPTPPTVEANRSEASEPELVEPDLAEEEATASDIPEEPPFLGEFEVPVINEPGIAPEPPAAVSVPDEAIPMLEAEESVDEAIAEDVPPEDFAEEDFAEEDFAEEGFAEIEVEPMDEMAEEPAVEADEVAEDPTPEDEESITESVAAAPDFDPGPNADFVVEPAPAASEFEPAELDLSEQAVTPQDNDRWPEPIPFGAPLPQ